MEPWPSRDRASGAVGRERFVCVITYLQHARVALPYLFHKYCLPNIRDKFPGQVFVYHIFDTTSTHRTCLQSSRAGQGSVRRVHQFIEAGRFKTAKIIYHSEKHSQHPMIPSVRRAVEVALNARADLHLWLEDDAIVADTQCNEWPALLRGHSVGIYRDTWQKQMINSAFFLSTPGFDRTLRKALREFIAEPHFQYRTFGSQYEHVLWRCASTAVCLNPNMADRHHPYRSYRRTASQLRSWLQRRLPVSREDLDLLSLDYSD